MFLSKFIISMNHIGQVGSVWSTDAARLIRLFVDLSVSLTFSRWTWLFIQVRFDKVQL